MALNDLFRPFDGAFERIEFIIYFLQFTFGFACRNYSCTSLVKQGVLPAEESAYHDGVIATAIKSHEAKTSAIKASCGGLKGFNQFHCFELGSTTQCSRRKSG